MHGGRQKHSTSSLRVEKHAKPARAGYSPAQLMFGRSQQLLLPQPASAFQPIDYEEAAARLDEKFHSSLSHYDRDKVQLPPLLPGEAVFIQCEKSKKWEKKGRVLEKRPDGLSYLVDIDGRLAVRSRFFLKPVSQGGQGRANDVTEIQDQGEFHSSFTPPLRCSSRLVEKIQNKKEKEKCSSSSCAPALVIPMQRNSASSNCCSGYLDRIPRRQRTPSTNQLVDSRSLTYNGLHLPLGQTQSSSARCSSSPLSSAAGFVPAISARAGPVMARSSISSGPLLAAPLSPCWSHELSPASWSPLETSLAAGPSG